MNLFPRVVREHPAASILAFCLFVIALLAVRNLLAPEQDARLMAIRQAGYPVTLTELNAFYPAAPPDQNAALVYDQVFRLESFTNSIFDDLTRDAEFKRGEALPAEICASLSAAIATNALPWQLLHSATNFPASRYGIDMREGAMVRLEHLAKLKRATTLLSLEGVAHASTGETNEAFAAFNAALHVGDSLREEPILISYLVRIACSALVARRVEQSLNLVAFQDDQLLSLQDGFAATGNPRWAARALAGERAFGLSFFIDRNIQHSATQVGGGVWPSGLGGQLVIAGYRASGLMSKDRNFFLDSLGQSIALAELPAPDRIKEGPPPSMVTSNRFLILSRMILPALQRVLDRTDEHSARMRVVETALGVERFRMAHSGALPDNLQQLAPLRLRAVPLDPFDSQPLRYKKLPSGYVVYSIGPDRQDDGGAEPPPRQKSSSRTASTPKDLTFVVERK